MTFFIFLLGTITVILSSVIGWMFYGQHSSMTVGPSKNLTRALAWQLAGEAIIGLGTLTFATAAHFGWLPNWSIAVQSALRLVMFVATSLTTVHLFLTVKKIMNFK